MHLFIQLSLALLVGQFHPVALIPRLSKGYEDSGISGDFFVMVLIIGNGLVYFIELDLRITSILSHIFRTHSLQLLPSERRKTTRLEHQLFVIDSRSSLIEDQRSRLKDQDCSRSLRNFKIPG